MGTGLGLAAAGCSSRGGSTVGLGPAGSADDGGVALVSLTDPDHVLTAGRPQRIPFSVVDHGSLKLAPDVTLAVTIRSGPQVVDRLSVQAHQAPVAAAPSADAPLNDLTRYFPLRATLPTPGIYDLEVDFGSGLVRSVPVQAFDPATVSLAGPGSPMPRFPTPTVADPAGSDPVCSLVPPCPLHQRSAAEVLAAGQPLALLASAPGRCDSAFCGAVLQALVAEAPAASAVAAVHLEYYANEKASRGGPGDPPLRPAPGVAQLRLGFQPSLFVVARDGTITERLDGVFNRDEIRAALAAVA